MNLVVQKCYVRSKGLRSVAGFFFRTYLNYIFLNAIDKSITQSIVRYIENRRLSCMVKVRSTVVTHTYIIYTTFFIII